jgi:hypothetical protein
MNWKLAHSRGGRISENALEKGVRGKELIYANFSEQMAGKAEGMTVGGW